MPGMRFEYVIVAAAIAFLTYTYFHDASEVEYLWHRFVDLVAVGAISK